MALGLFGTWLPAHVSGVGWVITQPPAGADGQESDYDGLLSGDGFGLLQHGESDLRLTELLILFLKSAVPVLSDGGLSF